MITHRQKLIKMADTSELGWRVVNEYISNPLASDSDDEKRIYKAEARANRKYKAERSKKTRRPRTTPYGHRNASMTKVNESAATATTSQSMRRPPGLCFACGKPGHWKGAPECTASNSNNKISIRLTSFSKSIMENSERTSHILENGANNSPECMSNDKTYWTKFVTIDSNMANVGEQDIEAKSPVGRLKKCIAIWQRATKSRFILEVVENGYKLPLKELPNSVILKNNRSASENPHVVTLEIQRLLAKGVISRSENVPLVVNPLSVAYNRNGKPRLVLDCRHINQYLHLFRIKFEDNKGCRGYF